MKHQSQFIVDAQTDMIVSASVPRICDHTFGPYPFAVLRLVLAGILVMTLPLPLWRLIGTGRW